MADINTFLVAEGDPGMEQLVGGLVVYIYFAYALMVLARRLGKGSTWMAWVPIANCYLLTKMAGLEWWWMLGMFIPFVNFFVAGYIWSEIGKKFGKPWWVGALVAIPVLGLFIPGYLVITTGNFQKPPQVTLPAA